MGRGTHELEREKQCWGEQRRTVKGWREQLVEGAGEKGETWSGRDGECGREKGGALADVGDFFSKKEIRARGTGSAWKV